MTTFELDQRHVHALGDAASFEWFLKWIESRIDGEEYARHRLQPDISGWLNSHDTEWSVRPSREPASGGAAVELDIHNDRVATLFKLTWM